MYFRDSASESLFFSRHYDKKPFFLVVKEDTENLAQLCKNIGKIILNNSSVNAV